VKRGKETAPLVADTHPFWAPYAQRNQLFVNDGQGTFRDVSSANTAFCGRAAVGRGLACGDIDNDGAVDLLVTATGGPAQLFRNIAPHRGHWLSVRAIDPSLGGRDACGAEIRVRAGARQWWRLVNPGFSYLCSHDPRAHFGVGSATTVDSIEVLWPDGSEEKFSGGPTDRFLILRKGSGSANTKPEGR
jgi:enediyne biosynthesis protein E4